MTDPGKYFGIRKCNQIADIRCLLNRRDVMKPDTISAGALSTPLSQESVSLLVIDRIKEALVNKELRPGDYFTSEDSLVRSLGVGKSSVREAVKMLQAMGVVEVRRGQGTLIRQYLGDDIINPLIFQLIMEGGKIDDVVDIRMMFEPAYSILAMHRATDDDIAAIKATVDHFEAVIAQGTQQAEDDIAFHRAILKATYTLFVIRFGETILQLFMASISRSMSDIPVVVLSNHKHILAAFLSKDEAALRSAILESFKGWEASLQKNRSRSS
jgi:GntR family transcriptional repressor for pyruvate dehydrogenase complex